MEGVPHVGTEFKPSRVVYHTRMIRAGDLHGLVLERKERIDSRQDQPVIVVTHFTSGPTYKIYTTRHRYRNEIGVHHESRGLTYTYAHPTQRVLSIIVGETMIDRAAHLSRAHLRIR